MGSIPVRVTKTKGHPSRVSFLFCCDSVGIDPLERKAFGYGFVTLLRPSLWEACKTEQIPVQNLDGSMPERFLYSGGSYSESNPATYVAGFAYRLWRYLASFVVSNRQIANSRFYPSSEGCFLSYGVLYEESHPMGIAARILLSANRIVRAPPTVICSHRKIP